MKKAFYRTIGTLILGACLSTAAYGYSGPEYVNISRKVEGDNVEYRYSYPKLDDAVENTGRADINTSVRELAQKGAMQALLMSKRSSGPVTGELTYEAPYGGAGAVSFVFTGFLDAGGDKSPMIRRQGVTYSLQTGLELTLDEIFTSANYLDIVNDCATEQLKAKGLPTADFDGVPDNQNFYITQTELVVVYNPGELAPRESGILEIRVPLEKLPVNRQLIY